MERRYKDNQGPGEAKNGVGEGRDPTENQNESVQAEDNNSRQQEKETVVIDSRRCRKTPVTRRDDFLWTATSKKTGKIEKEGKIKDSSQAPRNKSLKLFHQNIRGLGNKNYELYCHLYHDLPHILCLSEHHLSESELQLIHLTNYSLGSSYCRKTFLKEVSYLFTETEI
jgi:hypothetical protein